MKYKVLIKYLDGGKQEFKTDKIDFLNGAIALYVLIDVSSPKYGLEYGIDKKEIMITKIIPYSFIKYINVFEE